MTEFRKVPLKTGVTLNVALAGPAEAPPVIMLHGFPESHRTWRGLVPLLEAEFRLVMPDQRGFAGSDRPQDVEAYRADTLVDDIFALAEAVGIERFALVGHDWGGAIAWPAALRGDPRLTRLTVINAPHPVIFQKSLIEDSDQRAASQYITAFRTPGFEKAAAEAGIKLDGFVGSDNYEGGRVAGQHLVQVTGGKANVGLLEGIPGHETGDSRLKGFHDAIKDSPGVKVVASQTANWERDQGFSVFQNMLQAHPEIDALFACSDMMALGAIEAIAAAGKTGKIRVIGFDAVDDARKAIEAGTLLASVAQFPSEMGRLAVEDAVALIRGGRPPAERKVRIELVTKETLASR